MQTSVCHVSRTAQMSHIKDSVYVTHQGQCVCHTSKTVCMSHIKDSVYVTSKTVCIKLQGLVYDILPSTSAVFSYAIGSRKLSDNEHFFCWCSNSSKFVTNNSNSIRHLFYVAMLLMPAQIKPKLFELRRNLSFYPGWICLTFTCVLGR